MANRSDIKKPILSTAVQQQIKADVEKLVKTPTGLFSGRAISWFAGEGILAKMHSYYKSLTDDKYVQAVREEFFIQLKGKITELKKGNQIDLNNLMKNVSIIFKVDLSILQKRELLALKTEGQSNYPIDSANAWNAIKEMMNETLKKSKNKQAIEKRIKEDLNKLSSPTKDIDVKQYARVVFTNLIVACGGNETKLRILKANIEKLFNTGVLSVLGEDGKQDIMDKLGIVLGHPIYGVSTEGERERAKSYIKEWIKSYDEKQLNNFMASIYDLGRKKILTPDEETEFLSVAENEIQEKKKKLEKRDKLDMLQKDLIIISRTKHKPREEWKNAIMAAAKLFKKKEDFEQLRVGIKDSQSKNHISELDSMVLVNFIKDLENKYDSAKLNAKQQMGEDNESTIQYLYLLYVSNGERDKIYKSINKEATVERMKSEFAALMENPEIILSNVEKQDLKVQVNSLFDEAGRR